MSLDYDPTTSLVHHPTPMGRFGKNPYGENLYRIVWAPSRRSLVYGEWADGSRKASWSIRYPEAHGWILERWLSAQDYARCSAEQWTDRGLDILGPYPARGEYELAHEFHASSPTDANLDKLISWIEEGRKRRYQEHKDACQSAWDSDRKGIRNTQDAIIRDALPYKSANPLSSQRVSRGTKTRPVVKTAEELGLPTKGGKFITT